jgi:hypothetical protein
VDRADVIVQTCAFIQDRNLDAARDLILDQYPPSGLSTARGKRTEQSLLRIFVRDRFTDRYFGVRLIFPGTLRMLSLPGARGARRQQCNKEQSTYSAHDDLPFAINDGVTSGSLLGGGLRQRYCAGAGTAEEW